MPAALPSALLLVRVVAAVVVAVALPQLGDAEPVGAGELQGGNSISIKNPPWVKLKRIPQ